VIACAHVRTGFGLLCSVLLAAAGARAARAEAPASAPSIAIEQALAVAPGVGCLERERLAAQVRFWLGRSRVASDVRISVRGDARRVEFELWRGRSRGTRTFDPLPDGCDQAHAAVGLAIALAIDADLLVRLVEPEAAARAAPPRWLWTLALGGGYAVLPDLSFGAGTGLEFGLLEWLSARADLFVEHAPGARIEPSPGRFDATLFGGALRLCAGGRALPALRFALCGGPAAGVLHARGRNFAASYAPTGAWSAIASGLRVELDVGVSLVLDVDLIAPLHSPSFRIERESAPALRRDASEVGGLLRLGVGFGL
jgi:hypothetical protein